MCDLLCKGIRFEIDDNYLNAFNKLKKELIYAPIITSQNLSLFFELMCNATDYAVGAVFGQRRARKLHVLYYISKALNDAQIN